jgi:hypothetical protein
MRILAAFHPPEAIRNSLDCLAPAFKAAPDVPAVLKRATSRKVYEPPKAAFYSATPPETMV